MMNRKTLLLVISCVLFAGSAHAQEGILPIPLAPPEPIVPGGPPCDRSCEGLPCHDDGDVGENCTCQPRFGGASGGGRRGETMPEDPDGPPLNIAVLRPGICMEQGAPPIEFPPGPELPPDLDPMPLGPDFWPFLSLAPSSAYHRWYFEQRIVMPHVPPHWRELGEMLRARR